MDTAQEGYKTKEQPVVALASDLEMQEWLPRIVQLLVATRRFFILISTVFLFWQAAEVFWLDEGFTFVEVVEVVLVSLLAPALVWSTSKWGEKLAKEMRQSHSHSELLALSQIAQNEAAQRAQAEGALQRSEEFRRSLIDNSPDTIAVLNDDGIIMYQSPSAGRLLGYRPEELIGKNLFDFIHSYDLPDVRNILTRAFQTPGVPQSVEFRFQHKDGSWRVLETVGKTHADESGVRRVIVSSRDITERKQVEERLRESEERYRAVVENSADAIAITVGTKRVFVNKAFLEIHGVDDESQVLGMPLDQFIVPEDRQRVVERTLARQKGEASPGIYEYRIRKSDGEVRTLQITGTSITYNGKPASLTVLRDVTERKRAEDALRESEERYRAVAENSADGIAVNVRGKRAWVNKAFLEIHGLDQLSQALGKPLDEFIIPEEKHRVLEMAETAQRTGLSVGIHETRVLRPNGEVRTLQVSTTPIIYGGQPASVAILRDITDQKRLQEQLMRADKLAAIGTLVSGVAHEVNNPLTGALGFVDLLLNQDLDESAKADLRVVHDEIRRASDTLRNLLPFSREHKPEKTYVSINETLKNTLALRAYELRLNNIEVKKDFQPDLPDTLADASQLRQVWLNLILNAEQAMTEAGGGGTLYLKTRRADDGICISIADDGPGIPAEVLPRIFDPFFTTKPVGKGTGLGLSICYGIIQEHDGDIDVTSEVGKGTTFTVRLPIVSEGQASTISSQEG